MATARPDPPSPSAALAGIADLPGRIAALPDAARERAERLFRVEVLTGRTDPPAEMDAWLVHHFGSVAAVREQTIVRIQNRWTLDGALFSPLRGRRPIDLLGEDLLARETDATRADPFCSPETETPADTWGRIRGAHTVSGANAAKYDGHHGVIVFDRHDPLAFDEALVVDLLATGRAWAEREREADPAASAYLLIWNCGRRAGGSIVHGHAQVLLGRGAHYARVERLRRDAGAYRSITGRRYVDDLAGAHRDLGLAIDLPGGVAVVASLTPVKEREVLVLGPPGMDERDPAYAGAVARTVVAYRDALGVRAFNLALQRPPIDPALAGSDGWQELGPLVHLVDRGNPAVRSSDIGAMELFAASVVGSDPFEVAVTLRSALT
jgi:hypothetical protein